jgi:hypothetical protein
MFKKIIIAILLFSVLGAAGAALAYNAATQENAPTADTIEPLAQAPGRGFDQQGQQNGQSGSGEPVIVAQEFEGEPWQATGTIVAVDDYGFDFSTDSGDNIYIELGPPDFWQSQGVELVADQQATVFGSINEGMIHATQVQLADGQTLKLRNEIGQPLWSGGVNNSRGKNSAQGNGENVPQPQAQVDEWITIQGTLMSFQGGNMMLGTPEGELIALQTGQPRFFAEQGVSFQVGDEISAVGFYEGENFVAGDITQVSTGLRVMLRDPNGRPLWAGPGNGNGNNGTGGGGNGKNRGNI